MFLCSRCHRHVRETVCPFCGAAHRRVELLGKGIRERVRRVEAAPNLPFDHATYVVDREPWPAEERAAVERLQKATEAVVWA